MSNTNYCYDRKNLKHIKNKKGGHLDGAVCTDLNSNETVFIKIPKSNEQARSEVLASKIYQLAGVKTAEMKNIEIGDKVVVQSKWIDDFKNVGDIELKQSEHDRFYENFVIDAWLANWDVIGIDKGNLGIHNNTVIRVDLGGALSFRAFGKQKSEAFGHQVSEFCTMLDPKINPNAYYYFKDMKVSHFIKGVSIIKSIENKEVKKIVYDQGEHNLAQDNFIYSTLILRKIDLIKKMENFTSSSINHESMLRTELCGLRDEDEENAINFKGENVSCHSSICDIMLNFFRLISLPSYADIGFDE